MGALFLLEGCAPHIIKSMLRFSERNRYGEEVNMEYVDDTEEERGEKAVVDTLLSDTFNSILRIEERSLKNRLTEGLSVAELHTIVAVGLHEINSMKVVAKRLDVTMATLTAAMNKLERKGFVERSRSDTDRRQVLVQLTSKGRKAFRAHESFHKRMVDSALAVLTPEEETVFVSAVGKIKEFFDKESKMVHGAKA